MSDPETVAPEHLLTVDQVCAWFQVTKDWVYDEVQAERLPHLRLGRRTLRFDPVELRAHLAGVHRATNAAEPNDSLIKDAGE